MVQWRELWVRSAEVVCSRLMRSELLNIRMFCELRVKSILNALLLKRPDGAVGRANGLDYGSTWFKSNQVEIIFVK